MARLRSLLAVLVRLALVLRRVSSRPARMVWWFIREQIVTIVWMSLIVVGVAGWSKPASLIVGGLCLWQLHEKIDRDLH